MAFSIKDEQTDKLVRKLAGITGESYTRAVKQAVAERLERLTETSEKEKEKRLAAMHDFLKGRPRLKFKDGKTLKEITDDLWGM